MPTRRWITARQTIRATTSPHRRRARERRRAGAPRSDERGHDREERPVFRRILRAYDGSKSAIQSFDLSLRLISSLTSDLAIVAVVCASDFALKANAHAIRDDAPDQFRLRPSGGPI